MSWIQTYSGIKFDPDDFAVDDFDLDDIAHAFGNICRFGGHWSPFYSVAQHSVLVSEVCEVHGGRAAARWGLFHDSAEAYVGDVMSPLKTDAHRHREAKLMKGIAAKFNLVCLDTPMTCHINAVVKHSDLLLMATERRDLLTHSLPWPHLEGVKPLVAKIEPVTSYVAMIEFKDRYKELF